ncbi:hypothetical protein HK405_007937, partial [Cladochytrium tenue]
ELDLGRVGVSDLDFKSPLELAATRAGTVHALCGWFDVDFAPPGGPGTGEAVSLSTGPAATTTHWKQVLFLLREPVRVSEGDRLVGTFACAKSSANSRDVVVDVTYSVVAAADGKVMRAEETQRFHIR